MIARGTIGDTVIEDNVKIDDRVFVAHNCRIGRNTLVIAGSEISGSVEIGEGCWIAPNCAIIDKIKIGDKAKIGIGSVVTEDVPANTVLMGLEGVSISELREFKKRLLYGKKLQNRDRGPSKKA